MLEDVHELANRLAQPLIRAKEAARIACEAGAEAFLILLYDPEIDALTPAPGFPQTLPGGPLWRAFLKKQPVPGATFTVQLPFPDQDTLRPAQCFACGSVVFLLIGESSRLPIERFADTPLLPALLEAEAAQLASTGLVRAASEATQRATKLAGALDRARTEIGKKATELSAALLEADHLNRELSRLNQTLEQRVADEIRERMQVEEALRQAQKMEAVGQLTGGIAHDFNNMLAVVIGSLDLLGRRLGSGDARAKRYVDAATEGARRAALLTQRLLAFSRQQPLRPEPIDLNTLVGGMSDLIRGSLGSDIRLETVLVAGGWRVHADPNQLENVLLNLAVNARDAMPGGGRLTIETQKAHVDARYAAANLGVPAGQYVLVAVTDTGSGMPAEVIAKAFDPFFTTKEVGKGTGLGLSQVYGFVKQSGGHVKIYSEPDQGTTVKVYLPRLIGSEHDGAEEEVSAELLTGESEEVVLVVEDELAVRQFSVDALGELGYHVLEADGAIAALRLIDAHPEIKLLFTDVVMPDTNGRKLADEARQRRPDLKVLFTTGYTRNAVIHNGVLDPGVELIGKPFTIEELAAKVREVLDAPVAPSAS